MRFSTIPPDLAGAKPWGKIIDFGPPPGHEESTGHLQVLVEPDEEYGHRFNFLLELEPSDLKAIEAGARHLWVGQVGNVLQPVFHAGMAHSRSKPVEAKDR